MVAIESERIFDIWDGDFPGDRKATIVFVNTFRQPGCLRWQFVKCQYSFGGRREYDFEDWVFLGKVADEISRLKKELEKT